MANKTKKIIDWTIYKFLHAEKIKYNITDEYFKQILNAVENDGRGNGDSLTEYYLREVVNVYIDLVPHSHNPKVCIESHPHQGMNGRSRQIVTRKYSFDIPYNTTAILEYFERNRRDNSTVLQPNISTPVILLDEWKLVWTNKITHSDVPIVRSQYYRTLDYITYLFPNLIRTIKVNNISYKHQSVSIIIKGEHYDHTFTFHIEENKLCPYKKYQCAENYNIIGLGLETHIEEINRIISGTRE